MPAAVAWEERERIAYLVLDSPPGNAIGARFFDELARLTETVLARPDREGVIVCGRGRHFSSGTDVGRLKADVRKGRFDRGRGDFRPLSDLAVPVVAAVRGCCLGSGVELALACHYRVAGHNALFALPETQFDLMPGCGATVRLPGLVGRGKAIELVLSGMMVSAAEALEIGLVDRVVRPSEVLPVAEAMVRRLAREREH